MGGVGWGVVVWWGGVGVVEWSQGGGGGGGGLGWVGWSQLLRLLAACSGHVVFPRFGWNGAKFP